MRYRKDFFMTTEGYEIHKTAIKNYLNKFDDIKVRVPYSKNKGDKRAYYRKQSKKLGYESLNDFIVSLMDYAIKNKLTADRVRAAAVQEKRKK